jgi:hypothetical protein
MGILYLYFSLSMIARLLWACIVEEVVIPIKMKPTVIDWFNFQYLMNNWTNYRASFLMEKRFL